ncbi:unnamed protein product [Echinostoma caproni]|uniref:CYCLIN domain-containing protein n=1 Tax=Echinostoma caproni TaxID=27848 RepID=A0A183AEN0_9TREM|nr:unnamed protein product [Echinostoma caproni]
MAASKTSTLQRGPDPSWDYCGVKLTIHNIIIPLERLSPTPSQLDNMSPDMEIDLRIVGCELIQDSGVLLKLPQVAMATAQVLYQRFFYSKSFVRHFYELVICYLQALGQESNPTFVQTAWNYMNDSLRTDLFVRYLPEAIACACIYLASCKLGIPLPRHPAWWEMFTVDEESVREIALCLVRLYARPKANIAELEAELAKLRKSQVEAKEREIELKKVQSSVTPDNASDHSSITLSPNALIVSKKNLVTTKGSSSSIVGDSNTSVPDMTQSLPPNSILASALATAKAVAASITASKAGNASGPKVDSEGDANSGPSHPDEAMKPDINARDRAGGRPKRAIGSKCQQITVGGLEPNTVATSTHDLSRVTKAKSGGMHIEKFQMRNRYEAVVDADCSAITISRGWARLGANGPRCPRRQADQLHIHMYHLINWMSATPIGKESEEPNTDPPVGALRGLSARVPLPVVVERACTRRVTVITETSAIKFPIRMIKAHQVPALRPALPALPSANGLVLQSHQTYVDSRRHLSILTVLYLQLKARLLEQTPKESSATTPGSLPRPLIG